MQRRGLLACLLTPRPFGLPWSQPAADHARLRRRYGCSVSTSINADQEVPMPHYLSDEELKRTSPAEIGSFRSPIPTQIVSNGEFNPLPQTRQQQQVEARIQDLADDLGRRHGMDRRRFLASTAGMAAAFLAMNEVFGALFDVTPAEAQTPGVADQRARALAGQFIIDDQTHF